MTVSRRAFLQISGAAFAGLVIEALPDGMVRLASAADATWTPNNWLALSPDGRVTVYAARAEMGQGVRTSLPLFVAEELRVSPQAIEVVTPEPGTRYPNMRTSGSGSVLGAWTPLRKAGAAARLMLVSAAAKAWSVPAGECDARDGFVVHAKSGRKRAYGSLAALAAAEAVPADVPLATTFNVVGTRVPRHDGKAIVTGAAKYGLDLRVPGMRFAAIARPPSFGSRLTTVEDGAARKVPGVTDVVRLDNAVAVVASSTWAAVQGRDALELTWTDGDGAHFDSHAFQQQLAEATLDPKRVSRDEGGALAAYDSAAKKVDALYEYGFHVHAPMEPMNAIAHVRADGCEVWTGTQAPNQVQEAVAQELGIAPEKVRIHVPLLGGGFGRRLGVDYAVEAVRVARAVQAPVQVVWTRADDMVHGFFQPASANRLKAGLGADGRPVAWIHAQAASPHNYRRPPEIDDPELAADNLWGVHDNPYLLPAVRTSYEPVLAPMPLGPWRAVFYPTGVFARECFLDELAHAAGQDPLAYRLALLPADESEEGKLRAALARALKAAADKAGWGGKLAGGRALGIAGNVYHGMTVMAQVAEVSVDQGNVRVHRVTVAVDCGRVVNPLGLEGQIESAVLWGMAGSLFGEITFKDGRAEQSSFADYPLPRFADAPEVVVEILPSPYPPLGIGEQPVAPVAAAIGNAIFAATGQRLRKLPFRLA